MKIRAATISFSRNLAKSTNCREMEITRRLQALDELICNNFHASDIDQVLNEFDDLKTELQTISLRRETQQFLDRSVDGWKKVSAPPNTFLT